MPARSAGPAGFAESAAAAAGRMHWWLGERVDHLELTATSLLGVCLALGICASGWLTAGTRSANVNGAVALCCGYVAALVARRLASQPGARADNSRPRWLAMLVTRVFDCVVYLGLTIGALALGWGGQMWTLALAALGLVSVRETMTACSTAGGTISPGAERDGLIRKLVMIVATMPPGGRVLLIAVAAPIWGPRAALVGLLDWGIISVGLGIGSQNAARRRRKHQPAGDAQPPRDEISGMSTLLHTAPPEPTAPAPPAAAPTPATPATPAPATPAPSPGPITRMPPVAPAAPSGSASTAPSSSAAVAGPVASRPVAGRQPISVLRMEINAPPAPSNEDMSDAAYALADNARDTVPPWFFDFDADNDDVPDTDHIPAVGPVADPYLADHDPYPRDRYASAGAAATPEADPDTDTAAAVSHGAPEDARIAAALAAIMRCRDDGIVARWFGGLASGQLMPLPPALLALAGVALLAHLGLRDLPGLLIVAPALVMLVAAPGASHRHDGRLDWLVPAVLLTAQFIYIVALGSASGVPAPITFALCACLAVLYADLGSAGSPPLPGKNGFDRSTWLGWDGRMLVCGLGAATGIAMFAYLALAAYLAMLVCWKIAAGYSGSQEGDCR